ncbi:MAG: SPFH domain-containing protein [Thermoplasmata archaeon]
MFLLILLVFFMLFYMVWRTSFVVVQPYEQGVLIVNGRFKRILNPGINIVPPFISQAAKIDLREKELSVGPVNVITKDGQKARFDGTMVIQVRDPKKAYLEVTDHKRAAVSLMETVLKAVLQDMEFEKILWERTKLYDHLMHVMNEALETWGTRLNRFEFTDINKTGHV